MKSKMLFVIGILLFMPIASAGVDIFTKDAFIEGWPTYPFHEYVTGQAVTNQGNFATITFTTQARNDHGIRLFMHWDAGIPGLYNQSKYIIKMCDMSYSESGRTYPYSIMMDANGKIFSCKKDFKVQNRNKCYAFKWTDICKDREGNLATVQDIEHVRYIKQNIPVPAGEVLELNWFMMGFY